MQDALTHVLTEVRSAWRFRWYGVGAAWAICVAGWAFVALQPNVYQASASVYVDASSVLQPILSEQIVSIDVASQLNYVREALLGRAHLERVATANNLFPAGATPSEREDLISRLREEIVVISTPQRIATDFGERISGNSIFNIIYQHSDRDVAIGVVETLLDSLVSGTLDANAESADKVRVFLDQEIAAYAVRLEEAEQALAEFRRRNAQRLPGTSGSYFDQITTQRNELEDVRRELRRTESRRDSLKQQLSGQAPMVAGTSTDREGELPPNSLDARIRDYQAQLDRLLLQYTDRHPDVQSARDALAALREQRAAELRALGIGNADQELSGLETNPLYQSLRIDLSNAEVEVATLQAEAADRSQRLSALQALMNEIPAAEAEYQKLTRDYDTLSEYYETLVGRREKQDLSSKASATDEIDFDQLNPPAASTDPVAPARLKLLAVVFFAGIAGACGLCYLLAQARPVFGSRQALRDLTELPVLGNVSFAGAGSRFAGLSTSVLPVASCFLVLGIAFVSTVAVEAVGPGWNITQGD
jgi:polysaccharide chain length determinant protein (PEP-CTERM system associated)